MPMDINQLFTPYERVMSLASRRMDLLAANIANADTPNYKARDIDFRAALAAADARPGTRLATTRSGHMQGVGSSGGSHPATLYRIPEQPSLDGNTVDAQKESAAVAETASRYQASLSLLDMQIRNLRMAITGGR